MDGEIKREFKMKLIFKTRNPFFEKEEDGVKNNTVREVDVYSSMFDNLMEIIQADDYVARKDEIEIINPRTKESFVRIITDVSFFDERWIITWKHKEELSA